MDIRIKALSVHLFTATGAVLSMLAMLAAVEEKWSLMFLWLVVALVVDGIDGPLARRYEVKTNCPTYDGVLMDLIIDYLTYVFIPAYALFKSGLLPGWTGWLAIIAITYLSVIYFADTRMKTKDCSFSGFPACWNMVVLVLFAISPGYWVTLAVVLALAVAMFFPLKFIHPTRTKRWRPLSLSTALLWTVFAAWAAWVNFHEGSWAHWGLVVTSVYLLGAGILQQIFPARHAD
ncbi:CDP-alcohol phosphatidyltransferase family protein [Rhodobacter maris]|uniref:Phosphatidylcholine synthase n=1 Tax=Rhodobacter maris TaxID=446682 RepID=A0A285RJQ1_9RHOB|nr:CDP-alcohol phosphatidyltransferase family protein [Rhodobacter maris]SOB94350.1 CDP-diacylglycerol-choline O-phosphatidyltransferase [Rhodobacter maris]